MHDTSYVGFIYENIAFFLLSSMQWMMWYVTGFYFVALMSSHFFLDYILLQLSICLGCGAILLQDQHTTPITVLRSIRAKRLHRDLGKERARAAEAEGERKRRKTRKEMTRDEVRPEETARGKDRETNRERDMDRDRERAVGTR